MDQYIIPFIIAFMLTVVLTLVILPFGKKLKWNGRTEKRHIHAKGVLRIGGISMVLSFNAALLLSRHLFITPELYSVMISSLILLVIGFIDDIKQVFWKFQLFFQIAAAVFIFIVGVRIYYITNPLTGGLMMMDAGVGIVFSIILVIFWIVLVMNAVNWLDGIDGLSGSISLITAITILLLSFKAEVNQPHIAMISSAFIGVTLAFLVFNFNPSRILAGTSGAMFMGFILSTLAIISGTKIATALLVMVIPIIDLVWVIGERIRKGKSIFQADKNHLHYKLLDLGWSQRKIVAVYIIVTIIIAGIALNTRFIGKSITLLLAVLLMLVVSIMINKKINSDEGSL
jgi:UDP-GlcNAc:undecaprenyl-phosphate/decaprenyl-phosphate GlcNAc-1-phosphate transferase